VAIFIARKGGKNKVMDWKLAAKIAGGGFGMVFVVLAILYFTMLLTKIVVARIILKKEISRNYAKINDFK